MKKIGIIIILLIFLLRFGYSQRMLDSMIEFTLEINEFDDVNNFDFPKGYELKQEKVFRFDYTIKEYLYSLNKHDKFNGLKLILVTVRLEKDSLTKEYLLYKEVFSENRRHEKKIVYNSRIEDNYELINRPFTKKFQQALEIERDLVRANVDLVFGFACYFSGTIPSKYGYEMLKLVDRNDTEKLEKWLVSINPLKLIYGYIGFMLLEKRGTSISTKQKELLIRVQKKSNLMLDVCQGCTLSNKMTIPEIIDWDATQRFIHMTAKQ